MNNNSLPDKNALLAALMKASNGKIDKNAAEKAALGDASAALKGLDEESRNRINAALADKEGLKKLLSSDAARNIIKNLMGGEQKNG